VKENTLNAYENQDYPYGQLIKKISLKNDLSRNPLFDVMLNLRKQDRRTFDTDGWHMVYYEVDTRVSKVDLTLEAVETDEGIQFRLEYNTKLFKRETMVWMSRNLLNILNEVVTNPEVKITDIEMLGVEEKRRFRHQENNKTFEADFEF